MTLDTLVGVFLVGILVGLLIGVSVRSIIDSWLE